MPSDTPKPKSGHKYHSRKRVKGRWVYDYGDKPGTRRGSSQEPPEGTLVVRPGEVTPPRKQPTSRPQPTKADISSAVDAAVARLLEEKRKKAEIESLADALSGLFPPSRDEAAKPQSAPVSRGDIKPPGSKEELMRQVQAVSRWTSATLGQGLEKFRRDTGFQMTATEPGKRAGPNRVRATKEAATCLLAVRHLLTIAPGMIDRLKINVIASGKRAMATYSSGTVMRGLFGERNEKARSHIEIHDRDHGHSLLHEFGHFLDHYLGDPDKVRGFASGTVGSPMHSFVQAAKGSDSYKTWSQPRPEDRLITVNGVKVPLDTTTFRIQRIMANRNAKHLGYIKEPSEMVARFFDCWAHWKLGQRGYDNSALRTKPDYAIGGYSDADIEKLSPLFEKALGENLAKSVLRALKDLAWVARARSRAQGG